MTENNLLEFTKEDIALIKSQIAPEASKEQLELLLYQAKRTGLNPITRQIYAIFRNSKEGNNWVKKMTIQTSIDGFRVIAERSGNYGGQSEPTFAEDKNGNLISCKITVFRFRNDVHYPAATAVAYWDEYCQKDKEGNLAKMWRDMPRTMLSKVAEALALRKAYPQDLSGLYTNDEMLQAEQKEKIENERNNIGLKPNGDLAKGVDMKETFKQANEELFAGLKAMFESCGGVEEIEELLQSEKSDILKLKKYEPRLYEILGKTITTMRESFNK